MYSKYVASCHATSFHLLLSQKEGHDTTGGRNISASMDPEGLDCLVCKKKHNIGESIEASSPVAVVVSDQNFSPVLPPDDGNCVVVVRVEDG
jgi:hypothetical protein